jgi:hypothetical protein
MGMMDMGAMPQQMQQEVPQQGMMGGGQPPQATNPSLSHGQFNGIVSTTEGDIPVENGVMVVKSNHYVVSDDGSMVLDSQGNLIGHVEAGKFIEADAAYMDQMTQKGYLQ